MIRPSDAIPKHPISDKRWAVYYDTKLPAEKFKKLDVVVFDRRHYPEFKKLKGKTKVLAYISIGEVYDGIKEHETLKEKGKILDLNSHWNSHIVDITASEWQAMVLGYVGDAAKKGFDGVMLDTLDSPIHWARVNDPKRLERMIDAGAELVRMIHKTHPKMKIMLNRGFEVLPLVGYDIDYILAESILSKTDVSTGQFSLFPPMTYDEVAGQLHRVAAFAPHLQMYTLDYWDQEDAKGLEKIYAIQRANGFIPYVTTPDLRNFTPERD